MAPRRQPAVPGAHLIREAEAISAGAVVVFLALSFLSFSPDAPPANLGGPVGQALAGTALRALGVAAYLFPLYLGYFTVALLRRGAEGFGGLRLVGAALLVASIAALAGLVTGGARWCEAAAGSGASSASRSATSWAGRARSSSSPSCWWSHSCSRPACRRSRRRGGPLAGSQRRCVRARRASRGAPPPPRRRPRP